MVFATTTTDLKLLQFGFSTVSRVGCEPNRLLGYDPEQNSYEEPGTGQLTIFDQLRADELSTALEEALESVATSNKQREWFLRYHEGNLHVFEKFCEVTLEAIEKGFQHYGAMAVIQIMRWYTKTRAHADRYKINNNASPFYARMFESVYPEHSGFFRVRHSRADARRPQQQPEEATSSCS